MLIFEAIIGLGIACAVGAAIAALTLNYIDRVRGR